MRWQFRFAKNAMFGILPLRAQEKLRQLKRRIKPYPEQIDEPTLEQGITQIRMLREANCDPAGKDVLELGTGWQPVIPLLFHVAGARSVTMIDSQRLLDARLLRATCANLSDYSKEIAVGLGMDVSTVASKLEPGDATDLRSLLARLNLEYRAPYDICGGGVNPAVIDIVISRAVLEHIPHPVLKQIARAFHRILRPGGMMCHVIDHSDHWEHQDSRLSPLSFLRYSAKTFAWLCAMNPLDYQNRMRHIEYIRLFERAGFEVVADESLADQRALQDLERLKIHPDFQQYPPEELAILTSVVSMRKVDAN